MSQRRRRILSAVAALFLLVVIALFAVSRLASPAGTQRTRPASSTETLNGVEFRHYFTQIDGVSWHTVEAGGIESAETIVFVHGIPGSWYSWHSVMAALAGEFRVIALDLKGLGLSTVTEDDTVSYNAEVVAGEIVALMDAVEVEQFALVGHEWGAIVTSYLAGLYPERVSHFVRISTPISDTAINQIQTLKNIPQIGAAVLADGAGFVRRMYTGEQSSIIMGNVPGPVVITPIAEEVLARLVTDFSYEGTAQTIIRYYAETPPDLRGNLATLAADSTMPVLLLQGDSDPIQPLSFYPEIAGQFPDASFMLIEDSGHVPMLEQPQAVASLIRTFMDEAG